MGAWLGENMCRDRWLLWLPGAVAKAIFRNIYFSNISIFSNASIFSYKTIFSNTPILATVAMVTRELPRLFLGTPIFANISIFGYSYHGCEGPVAMVTELFLVTIYFRWRRTPQYTTTSARNSLPALRPVYQGRMSRVNICSVALT
jgi:hypothetical protein